MALLLRNNDDIKITKVSLNTELILLRKLEQIYLNGELDEEFNLSEFWDQGYNNSILLFPLIYSDLTRTSLKKLYDNIINYVIEELQKQSYPRRSPLELLLQIVSTSILIQYLVFESDIDKNIKKYKKIFNQIQKKYKDALHDTYITSFNEMFCEFNLLKYSESTGACFIVSNQSSLYKVITGIRNTISSGSRIFEYRINPVYLSMISRKLRNFMIQYKYNMSIPLSIIV